MSRKRERAQVTDFETDGADPQHSRSLPPAVALSSPDIMSVSGAVQLLERVSTEARDRLTATTETPDLLPEVVTMNVGGEVFQFSGDTLEKAPSSALFRVVQSFHKSKSSLPSDADGHLFLDRDPEVFRILLNVLRGYRPCIPELEMRRSCEKDATELGLQRQWEAVFPPPDELRFSGPGVSCLGQTIKSGVIVAPCGPFVTSGCVSATFSIDEFSPHLSQTATVSFGVMTHEEGEDLDLSFELGERRGSAGLRPTGDLVYSLPVQKKEATDLVYEAEYGHPVRVVLDLDKGRVTWEVSEEIRILDLNKWRQQHGGKHPPMAIVAMLKGGDVWVNVK